MRLTIRHHGHTVTDTTTGPGNARITIRFGGWLARFILSIDVEVRA